MMSKGIAVELYFDAVCERRMRDLWSEIKSPLIEWGSTPHISLSSHDPSMAEQLLPIVHSFAREIEPLSLTFASIGTFPSNEGVVFAAPVVKESLLSVHRKFHARLSEQGIQSHPYYVPGSWVPHCTLFQGRPELLPDVVPRCSRSPIFGKVDIVGIGLVEFLPIRTLGRVSLG